MSTPLHLKSVRREARNGVRLDDLLARPSKNASWQGDIPKHSGARFRLELLPLGRTRSGPHRFLAMCSHGEEESVRSANSYRIVGVLLARYGDPDGIRTHALCLDRAAL